MMCYRVRIKIKLVVLVALLVSISLLSACMDLASNEHKNRQALAKKITYHKGQVYTMRGIGGIFSRGMNRLEDKLEDDYHIRTSSTIWYKADTLSRFIIKHYQSGELTGSIILIGHSLGANEQIKVAAYLARANIPVALLITIDAVSPVRVPANVKKALNIYKPGIVPMFSGLTLKAIDPARTEIINFDVNAIKTIYVNHFTIDKNDTIQTIMLDNVLATLRVNGKQ